VRIEKMGSQLRGRLSTSGSLDFTREVVLSALPIRHNLSRRTGIKHNLSGDTGYLDVKSSELSTRIDRTRTVLWFYATDVAKCTLLMSFSTLSRYKLKGD
jgi:hypothetical protein